MSALPAVKIRPPEYFVNERAVKAAIKKIVQTYREYLYQAHGLKIFEFMPVSNGMGKHGIPDFNFCAFGIFLSIETKQGGNKPTARQKFCLEEIRASGGIAVVVDEHNLALVVSIFTELYGYYLEGRLRPLPVSGASQAL